MRRDIIRQDQYGRLAIAHEIARHGKDEVGVGVVHLGQEFVHRLHRDVGPALEQLGTPGLSYCLRRKGRASPDATRWAAPARLRQYDRVPASTGSRLALQL